MLKPQLSNFGHKTETERRKNHTQSTLELLTSNQCSSLFGSQLEKRGREWKVGMNALFACMGRYMLGCGLWSNDHSSTGTSLSPFRQERESVKVKVI